MLERDRPRPGCTGQPCGKKAHWQEREKRGLGRGVRQGVSGLCHLQTTTSKHPREPGRAGEGREDQFWPPLSSPRASLAFTPMAKAKSEWSMAGSWPGGCAADPSVQPPWCPAEFGPCHRSPSVLPCPLPEDLMCFLRIPWGPGHFRASQAECPWSPGKDACGAPASPPPLLGTALQNLLWTLLFSSDLLSNCYFVMSCVSLLNK